MSAAGHQGRRLLKACLAGEAGAADRFVRRYSDLVYHTLRGLLRRRQVPFTAQDLEDLHNAVFLHLFDDKQKRLRQYRGKNGCRVATWLRVVTVRWTLNRLRRQGFDALIGRRGQMVIDALQNELVADPRSRPDEAYARAERQMLLKSLIETLSPRERLFINLYWQHELSMAEIAALLNISADNAYTLKYRLIARLKKRLRTSADPAKADEVR
jgi:RNA polymerase sigma factor (sigma-70 family)